jgi:HK97 gp10 family phage protein
VIALKFDGGAAIAKALETLPARVSRAMQQDALLAAGERIRKDAAAKAPVEAESTGPRLRDNFVIQPIRRTPAQVAAETTAVVGIGVPRKFFYDWFAEIGTRHESARPFWRPAFDGNVAWAIKAIGAELWFALAKKGATTTRGSGGGGGLL